MTTDVAIVTPVPSVSPSFTTLLPSPSPSITGIVVTLTLTATDVTLDASDLETQIANEYGVDIDDVTIDTSYTVSGTIDIDIPEDVSDDELQVILQDSIADALGVHSSDVEVNVDPSTGDVTYNIVSEDDNAASILQDALESSSFLDDLNSEVSETLPSASVSEVNADDEVQVEVVVTIDASESDIDVEDANVRAVAELEDQGFSTDAETVFVTARPTTQPILPPTSSVPSRNPSRTGMLANFEITSVVTTSLTVGELEAIQAEIISGFDVSEDDISTTGTKYFSASTNQKIFNSPCKEV